MVTRRKRWEVELPRNPLLNGAGSILDLMGPEIEIPSRAGLTIEDDAKNLRADAVRAGVDWSEVG